MITAVNRIRPPRRDDRPVAMNEKKATRWARAIAEAPPGEANAEALARQASYSVAQYYRRFRKQVGERPIQLRRRLLLERAAYELTRSDAEIATIAFRAGFAAVEAFSRAFRKAFGVPPGKFRRLGATEYRLAAASKIHFAPAGFSDQPRQGELSMNVLDRLIGAHYVGMKAILDRCEGLTDDQLDRPVAGYYDPLPWMSQTQTLRTLLQHTTGASDAPVGERAVAGFRAALDRSFAELKESIATYERERMWDMTFVDADCDPPMVFSYGGWIGHVLVFQSYRRIACMMALSQLGISDLPFFDPVDYGGQ